MLWKNTDTNFKPGELMKQSAVCAGTFDPLTFGHLDVIERASRIFPRVVVGVAKSEAKSPLFSLDERIDLVRTSTSHLPGIEVKSFSGLLVDFAEQESASVIVRGLRAFSDFEYEFQMASMNRQLNVNLESVFLTPSEKYAFISSSLVKEVSKLGGDVSAYVSKSVLTKLQHQFS